MAILYTTAACGQCRLLKEKLNEKNISYALCDAGEHPPEGGITSVPTLELDDGSRLNMAQALRWISEVKADA